MSAPDLVIFDCDGVLVDSEIVAARVEARLLSKAGFEISTEELAERYAGMTFKDILLAVENEAGTPFQATLLEEAERLVDERLAAEVKATDGAKETVATISAKKCICSNSSAARLEISLSRTGIKALFGDNIYSAMDIEGVHAKPAPDIFLYASEQHGADPSNTFVIEDSVHGVKGASAAGMRIIGFTGASHSYPGHADRLIDAGAETVVNRMADVPAMIEALSGWGRLD